LATNSSIFLLGDFITEQKLLEILNQLSNGGSAVQSFITKALTDPALYKEFTTNRKIAPFAISTDDLVLDLSSGDDSTLSP
jgi:hypothetical protein